MLIYNKLSWKLLLSCIYVVLLLFIVRVYRSFVFFNQYSTLGRYTREIPKIHF